MADALRRARPRLVVAAVAAIVLLAASCGRPEIREPTDAEPRNDPAAAPPAVPASSIPPTLGPRALWTAPFSSLPKATNSAFVGPVIPEEGGDLLFLGVDGEGVTRWSAPRNPSCTAFAVTRGEDGRELVVLLDSDAAADRGLAATRITAAAYDPVDGAKVWGPVEVPGTMVGPGLVFAAIPHTVMSGESGPKVALSAATGEVVADENAGDAVLHEHHGTLLVRREGKLRAVDTATDTELWNSDALAVPDGPASGSAAPVVGYGPRPVSDSSGVIALEWSTAGGDESVYTINDLRTGTRLAELPGEQEPRIVGGSGGEASVSAVAVGDGSDGGRGSVMGLTTREPRLLWSRPQGDTTARPERIVAGVLYASDGETAHALDMSTGEPVGEGPWPAPVAATESGPALLPVEGGEGEEVFAAVPTED
ncbi:hypothetical protein HDA32_002986 [Spinactinospora alkalitolerans]|uniref:Uncharacterized protein n=1 Tax=Spinactinospora alkalitolerans TaxID=687207 RepID=A0A852TTU4_9ACTN|nr:PQQ-binding-like beta-propeller repeat protein [Spinactinospora alkalitolerans]NYE47866.1 hypothetical protein [Spinactinospora alkalitolerans]